MRYLISMKFSKTYRYNVTSNFLNDKCQYIKVFG